MQTARSKPLIELRPYQHAAMEAITRGFTEYQHQLAVKPTGSGKTVLFSALAAHYQPRRTLVLAHREELIDQAVDKIMRTTGLEADVEMAGARASHHAPVVVASVQTLMREQRRSRWPRDHFGLIVVDECFPAGTLVDGRPIETISVGDVVSAFDHGLGVAVRRPVTRVFRRETGRICHLTLSNGRQIICTPCHPFWDGSTYVPAGQLTSQSVVYGITQSSNRALQRLRSSGGVQGQEAESLQPQCPAHRGRLLLAGMPGHSHPGAESQGDGDDQPAVCFGADEAQQPHAQSGHQGEDAHHAAFDPVDSACAGREWRAPVCGPDASSLDLGMGDGNGGAHEATASQRLSHLLQAGHREPGTHDCRGSGRQEPLLDRAAGAGPEEGGLAPVARVESIAFYERGSDPEFERLCPEGAVFNLEVEEHHNYFAEGVLVHNCHHTLAESYLGTLRHFDQNAFVLGVTATPDRSDKRTLSAYYENVAFEITLLDLIKQGYLSPITVKTVPLEIDLDEVRTVAGDYSAEDLGHALEPYLEEIARIIAEEYPNRKTLVFLPLISCSEKFAALCRRHGLAAEHVDGGSPDRKAILERFSSGETTLLSNAMLLTEGYDEPSVDCVVCLRPTKIRSLYSQIVGRGTRIHPGKDHLLLLDFLWLSSRHSLIKPAHLIAADDKEAQEITEALEEEDGDLEKAQEAANADRTRKLVAQLRENRTRNSSTFDAMEFAVTLNDPSLARFEPTMGWHLDKVTPRQSKLLAKFGIDPVSVMTKGHAALLLDRIFMRLDLKLATAKQVRWLRKLGHPKPELASFKEASDFLNTRFTPKTAHP
jgi:superfamily II DNA or RNA helicase